MRVSFWFVLAGLFGVATACSKVEQPAAPELSRPATIKDIMDSMVDTSGDFLFESMRQIADEKGIRQVAPETDEQWADVRRHAFILLEAPNLMTMASRKVAHPAKKRKIPKSSFRRKKFRSW